MRQLAWLICDLSYVTEVTEAPDREMELVNVRPQPGCFGPLGARGKGDLGVCENSGWSVSSSQQHPERREVPGGVGSDL